jgi:hypothetical protein
MPEELDQRIDKLIDALDENLCYEPPTSLELLVGLLAKRCDEVLMTDMQLRGR